MSVHGPGESNLNVRFTLITCNHMEISTPIKVFRIEFTSFSIKQEYPFLQNSTLTFLSKKFKSEAHHTWYWMAQLHIAHQGHLVCQIWPLSPTQ